MRIRKHGLAKPGFASASYLRHDQISACHEVAPDQGIYKLTKYTGTYQRTYWMHAHITIVYAALATTSDQSVLHLLVGSLCTFVWLSLATCTAHCTSQPAPLPLSCATSSALLMVFSMPCSYGCTLRLRCACLCSLYTPEPVTRPVPGIPYVLPSVYMISSGRYLSSVLWEIWLNLSVLTRSKRILGMHGHPYGCNNCAIALGPSGYLGKAS